MASRPKSPPDRATLDSGWWPALTGQDAHLLGRIDGLPSCLSVYMASSITKLRLAQSRLGYRTVRAKARTSSMNRSGCSIAAKWPPRGISVQRVTL